MSYNPEADAIGKWSSEYLDGYVNYMIKYFPEQHHKVHFRNIVPAHAIGAAIHIRKSARHSDADYAKIVKLTDEWCKKYPDPRSFPKEW